MRGVNIIVFGATGFTGKFIVKELKDEKEVRGLLRGFLSKLFGLCESRDDCLPHRFKEFRFGAFGVWSTASMKGLVGGSRCWGAWSYSV
mmetsp:Transcript_45376/g.176328  ORF Transcript_45376/g.176328 Transcript_45376/m.176328 type:complete len:89 (+) Transcript_45376:198-464(+)